MLCVSSIYRACSVPDCSSPGAGTAHTDVLFLLKGRFLPSPSKLSTVL